MGYDALVCDLIQRAQFLFFVFIVCNCEAWGKTAILPCLIFNAIEVKSLLTLMFQYNQYRHRGRSMKCGFELWPYGIQSCVAAAEQRIMIRCCGWEYPILHIFLSLLFEICYRNCKHPFMTYKLFLLYWAAIIDKQ